MIGSRKFLALSGALGLALVAGSIGARADGYEVAAPAAAEEGRKFTYSFNVGATSDYVFRGISQSDNDPALQGGADFGYGILYAGVWASMVDFAGAPPADAEVDWYGGIKPTWNSPFGTINLDFGVIYYSYPGANPDFGAHERSQLRGTEGRLQLVGIASELGDRHHGLLVAGLLRRDRLGLDDRNVGRLDAAQVPHLHAHDQWRARLAEG